MIPSTKAVYGVFKQNKIIIAGDTDESEVYVTIERF